MDNTSVCLYRIPLSGEFCKFDMELGAFALTFLIQPGLSGLLLSISMNEEWMLKK